MVNGRAPGRFLRPDHSPFTIHHSRSCSLRVVSLFYRMTLSVGKSVSRKDGIGKATGRTKYADDIVLPGMLHGRTVRSTGAHGAIRDVRLAFDRTGFSIVDHRDIPGRNVVALIDDDQPF